VVEAAISFGRGWMRTSRSGRSARITDLGTTAMPLPAATQATIAWYEPYSMTRSGDTPARPSQLSRRKR
jgi:hypothetical protein